MNKKLKNVSCKKDMVVAHTTHKVNCFLLGSWIDCQICAAFFHLANPHPPCPKHLPPPFSFFLAHLDCCLCAPVPIYGTAHHIQIPQERRQQATEQTHIGRTSEEFVADDIGSSFFSFRHSGPTFSRRASKCCFLLLLLLLFFDSVRH